MNKNNISLEQLVNMKLENNEPPMDGFSTPLKKIVDGGDSADSSEEREATYLPNYGAPKTANYPMPPMPSHHMQAPYGYAMQGMPGMNGMQGMPSMPFPQHMPQMHYPMHYPQMPPSSPSAASKVARTLKDPVVFFMLFLIFSSRMCAVSLDNMFRLATDTGEPSVVGLLVRGMVAALLFFMTCRLLK